MQNRDSSDDLVAVDVARISGGTVGRGVNVRCQSFEAMGDFTLGDGVTIEAAVIRLGAGAEIGAGVTIRSIRGTCAEFVMGDHAFIDERCNIMVPRFVCGDYTRIFRDALISGYMPTTLGHNCWVGQGAILNSAQRLTIGNNVRMGGAQIWTHVASGEVLEGSRFNGEAPVTLEDDVWLMGFGHLISPGVTLARGTVVMAGSVVTKSTEPFHTYSGMPAQDVSDKLPAWDRPSDAEKWQMLTRFVDEFVASEPSAAACVTLAPDDTALTSAMAKNTPQLIFARRIEDWSCFENTSHSVFDLSTKTYLKQGTPLEVSWQNFALGFRARFIPRPVLTKSNLATAEN